MVHRRDFVEHTVSADLPVPRQAPVAKPGAAVDGHWILADAYTAEAAERLAAAGAIGLLVPRGTDDEGWMPKMIAGPPLAPIPVISVRTEAHQEWSLSARQTVAHIRACMPWHTVE